MLGGCKYICIKYTIKLILLEKYVYTYNVCMYVPIRLYIILYRTFWNLAITLAPFNSVMAKFQNVLYTKKVRALDLALPYDMISNNFKT